MGEELTGRIGCLLLPRREARLACAKNADGTLSRLPRHQPRRRGVIQGCGVQNGNAPIPMKTTTSTSHAASQDCIDACNGLLRGELSAAETYRQTVARFESDADIATLRQIQAEHEYAAELLRNNVLDMGGNPASDSGAWGTMASALQSLAKTFGESSALAGLRQGEEKGLEDYEDALEHEEVMPGCKDMIRSELLPRSRRHIATLQELSERH